MIIVFRILAGKIVEALYLSYTDYKYSPLTYWYKGVLGFKGEVKDV